MNVLAARIDDKSCVPDRGPLPAVNPAPRARREVVEGSALNAEGVEAISLVPEEVL